MSDRTKLIAGAAFWLIPLAAQFSDYHNSIVAGIFGFLGACFLVWAIVHHAQERRSQGKPIVEPSHLIAFGLIGAAFCLLVAAGGYIWQLTRPSSPAVANAAAVVEQPARVAPTKYYSRSEREELSDFCKQLRDILIENGGDGGGGGVYAKAARLHNDWTATTGTIRGGMRGPTVPLPNTLRQAAQKMREEFNDTRDSITKFQALLFGTDGIASKLGRAYPEEFALIVGPGANIPGTGIQAVSKSLDGLKSAIAALDKAAETNNEQLVIDLVESAQGTIDLFLGALQVFQKWEFDTVQRINNFRKTLSGA